MCWFQANSQARCIQSAFWLWQICETLCAHLKTFFFKTVKIWGVDIIVLVPRSVFMQWKSRFNLRIDHVPTQGEHGSPHAIHWGAHSLQSSKGCLAPETIEFDSIPTGFMAAIRRWTQIAVIELWKPSAIQRPDAFWTKISSKCV